MVLLIKLLKSWFHGRFLSVIVFYSTFAQCTVFKNEFCFHGKLKKCNQNIESYFLPSFHEKILNFWAEFMVLDAQFKPQWFLNKPNSLKNPAALILRSIFSNLIIIPMAFHSAYFLKTTLCFQRIIINYETMIMGSRPFYLSGFPTFYFKSRKLFHLSFPIH